MRLKSLVAECGEPRCTVAGEAANAAQALVWLATHECDLLLLDVQMPGRDGTQLAAELRQKNPAPAIVFVTAHAQHALKAFDLEAVDYLTKPVKLIYHGEKAEELFARLDRFVVENPEA
jgi:two-component system response regulator AlgR